MAINVFTVRLYLTLNVWKSLTRLLLTHSLKADIPVEYEFKIVIYPPDEEDAQHHQFIK